MTRKPPYKLYFLLLFISVAARAGAQVTPTIKASIDKNKILIGEPLVLTLEASFPNSFKTNFFDIDSIPHFEFLKPVQVDSFSEANSKGIKAVYSLTSFDSGHWVIPAISLNAKVRSDTIAVDVVFSDFDATKDYHDIKDLIEIKPEEKKDWLWYAVAGTVLVLLIIYFLLRRKKPVTKPAEPPVNAFEDAMKHLAILQKKQDLSPKEYYTGMVDVFRLYVLRKKNILSLQKTTDDLVRQLKPVIKDNETYNQLQRSLQLSDFVKFARYTPTKDDDLFTFNMIKKTIQHIEELA